MNSDGVLNYCGAQANSACYASSEVFDRLTGRTHTHQAAGENGLPAVQTPASGVAAGQAATARP